VLAVIRQAVEVAHFPAWPGLGLAIEMEPAARPPQRLFIERNAKYVSNLDV